MRQLSRACVFTPVLLVLCAWSGVAGAHGRGGTADLSLTVEGRITARCTIDFPETSVHVLLTDNPGSRDLPFSVDCNQPLKVSFISANGGLLHDAAAQLIDSPGFSAFLPYEMAFAVNAPGARTVTVNSEDVNNVPGGGSIGTAPFKASGNLALSWAPESHLFGGSYGDIIEIRISGDGETDAP